MQGFPVLALAGRFAGPPANGLRRIRSHMLALLGVVAAHLFVLRILPPLSTVVAESPTLDIQASIIPPPRLPLLPPEPILAKPEADVVPEHEIVVDDSAGPDGIVAVSKVLMSQVIPPKPDPFHTNPAPRLPSAFSKSAQMSVMMMVFVGVDGTIVDARIKTSTGNSSLDQLALTYVKAYWRFLPASFSGHPVAEWTTVLVPFSA